MLDSSNTINNAELIATTLINKSKRDFSYQYKAVEEQSRSFSPAYRDFILKIIKNSSLKIKSAFRDSYIIDVEDNFKTDFSKRNKNKIYTDIYDTDALPHELGHAVDFWFSHINSLTNSVIIKDNKTLYDIFTDEFEDVYEELYEIVMKEYKNIINSSINPSAYDVLINNISKYRELISIQIDKDNKETSDKRRKLQEELYDSNFVETYYDLYEKKCYKTLNDKYAPILDALSSKYNLECLFLAHHKSKYYKNSTYLPVQEFFANLFRAKVTSQHVYIDNLIKYLPKSFSAFEQLFVIFYDHIQNNKRFNDVRLKKVR